MKTQTWLAQSCQLQLQKIIDDMTLLKESLASSGANQVAIDIVSNRIFEMENSKKDMKVVEDYIRKTQVQKRLTE